MATPSEKAERVARAYRKAREQLGGVTDKGAQNLLKLIREFQKEVVRILARYSPDDPNAPYSVRILPEIIRALDDSIDELRRRGLAEIEKRTGQSFDLGFNLAVSAVALGSGLDFRPFVSPGLLLSLVRGPAFAYSEMTSKLAARIDAEIRNQALGIKSNTQTMAAIAKMIEDSPEVEQGQRKRTTFASQAEMIMRTETGRLFNSAHQATSEDASKVVPNLMKSWSATSTARRGHLEAERKYAVGGSTGPIPVRMKFEVTDYSRTGVTEFLTIRTGGGAQRVALVKPYTRRGGIIIDFMLYPGDPEASAGNWANCRCIAFNVFPDLIKSAQPMADEIGRGF